MLWVFGYFELATEMETKLIIWHEEAAIILLDLYHTPSATAYYTTSTSIQKKMTNMSDNIPADKNVNESESERKIETAWVF